MKSKRSLNLGFECQEIRLNNALFMKRNQSDIKDISLGHIKDFLKTPLVENESCNESPNTYQDLYVHLLKFHHYMRETARAFEFYRTLVCKFCDEWDLFDHTCDIGMKCRNVPMQQWKSVNNMTEEECYSDQELYEKLKSARIADKLSSVSSCKRVYFNWTALLKHSIVQH